MKDAFRVEPGAVMKTAAVRAQLIHDRMAFLEQVRKEISRAEKDRRRSHLRQPAGGVS
ncbi:hypothetical protein ACFFP0_16235 [Rhizobium puerariae]|uniref:Uncharacterized protein n=1 Tax=Rhizobium puerariae TaxID=1585791 RepID=A0ABV6AM55_9HYPH